uniref:Uncharacterized protein n=1 Tax=Cacopsylla melanoneura TaxID=428564 RepID=A0A8D8M483_9HEMI
MSIRTNSSPRKSSPPPLYILCCSNYSYPALITGWEDWHPPVSLDNLIWTRLWTCWKAMLPRSLLPGHFVYYRMMYPYHAYSITCALRSVILSMRSARHRLCGVYCTQNIYRARRSEYSTSPSA